MIKLDERQILIEAWSRYIANYSKGWSFSSAYNHTKVDMQNKAIRQMWANEAEAKRQAEREAEEARFKAIGMNLHSYSMTNYYANNTYNGD